MIFIGCTIRLQLFSHLCIYSLNIWGLYQCTTTDFRTVFLPYNNIKQISFYCNHAAWASARKVYNVKKYIAVLCLDITPQKAAEFVVCK